MKLLFCEKCWDIFKLDIDKERSCKCGYVTGKYINDYEAITNGKGISIAIGNGSLINAIRDYKKIEKLIPKFCEVNITGRKIFIDKARISHAWVRPNEGPGNPHTKVINE